MYLDLHRMVLMNQTLFLKKGTLSPLGAKM